ncbi:SH3 domain-containing protein [Plantibacter sp. MMLR14_011]|uniref:SH3 domain-containing protein n=1 Tax=Plantibacter sp. MMLR14_011 TaxID=1898746 RepID=UPI0020C87138|nr:SH3 domain-containing protein [Plantibacter sp. MMLR14_011]
MREAASGGGSMACIPAAKDRTERIDAVRCVLIADHEIPERPPLTVRPGDVVQVGDRDTEWPAFVFVTASHGTGWVPARHLDVDGSVGVVRAGYDTTELPAVTGDTVDVVEDDPESGWSWCRNADGREGWIPHRVLTVE